MEKNDLIFIYRSVLSGALVKWFGKGNYSITVFWENGRIKDQYYYNSYWGNGQSLEWDRDGNLVSSGCQIQ